MQKVYNSAGLPTCLRCFALLCLVMLVSSCATLDRSECEAGNWQEIGYRDGALGRGGEFLQLHHKACLKHGVSVVEPVYAKGYTIGLADFCLPETGYRLGRNEEIYNYVCPAELEKEFVLAYASGITATMAALQIEESFLENRLWHATVKHRHYVTSYEVTPAPGANGGATVVLREPRILDALRNQRDNYRDRRARLRGALAKADRFLQTAVSVPAVSQSSGSDNESS